MKILASTMLLGSALLFSACTSAPASSSTVLGDDELGGESNDGESPKADGTDTFGIMTAQKIGAFECNGAGSCTHVELARAGRSTTPCADLKTHATCAVRTLDFSKLNLSAKALAAVSTKLQASASTPAIGPQLLVRGQYVHGTNPVMPSLDWVTFQVSELWVAQLDNGTLDGTFVMVRDRGIRCITAPCPVFAETRVNSTRASNIEGLDWSDEQMADATTAAVADAVYEAETQPDGAIVNGFRTHSSSGPASTFRSVEQVFLRVK